MGFQGNLESVGFADILQLLAMGKKTGTLAIVSDKIEKDIYFKDGSIIWANSNRDSDLLENQLLKQGKITRADLAKGKEVMELTNKDLPSTLVFIGVFKKEDISEIILSHLESIIFDIFGWKDGDFLFRDNELPDTQHVINALNTMSILMEGTRRIDEWSRVKGALPPENTILQIVPSKIEGKEEIRLTPSEAQVLSLIDGERSLEEIIEKSPFGELETARALYGLKMAGIVRKAGVKESKKAVIAEQKEIVSVMVGVYAAIYDTAGEVLRKKLGRAGVKALQKEFDTAVEEYNVLEHIGIAADGKLDFVNFITLVEKLPESSRIHLVSAGLSSLISGILNSVQSKLGNRQKKNIITLAVSRTEELLMGRIELLKKYGVYSDITRILRE